ncbi:MAG: hypothetical protein IT422_03110 [Pirellulaceae bacterium]|nr:hypothetical protein [Pirellulaceae bacterium]
MPPPEPPPLRLTTEGPIPAEAVCRELGIDLARLAWMVRKGHVCPAIRGRKGTADKYFLSAVEDAWKLVLRERTFEGDESDGRE